ncbi:hypothetical protein [Streptococcus mitis]|uniref:Uncharacterized protein n=2 Tax=Streptococcus mitis TaxID=28037 RepID=A0A6M9F5W2_STRMT|nr:hypothetical protein [Streptococcus mitis]QKL33193.1 hypothetical protein M594_05665 [Streptococcus mitis]
MNMKMQNVYDFFKSKNFAKAPLTIELMQNNFIQEEGTGYRIDQPEKIPSQYTHLINYCKKRLQDGAVYFNRTVQCGELIFWMAEVSQALSKKELLDLQQNILKNYKKETYSNGKIVYDRKAANQLILKTCYDRIKDVVEP